jgi:hypothetical protein
MPRLIFLEGRPLYILPCRADDKRPTCPGGVYGAVADFGSMARLWSDHWGSLTGVATGAKNGITAVDVDPRRDGAKWLNENRERLPVTRTHQTRSDGVHLIFRYAAGVPNTTDRIAPGVETINDGRYVIWWPEHGYKVLVDAPIAEFPDWLADEVRRAKRRPASEMRQQEDGPPMAGEIPKPLYFAIKRRMPLSAKVSLHHQRRVIGILRDIVLSRTKLRNDGLNIAAHCLRELVDDEIVSRDVAEALLLDAATVCGYVAKDGMGAALGTIRSGLGSTRTISGPSSFG